MGIAYSLIRAAPETVAALKGRPRAVAEFVYRDADMYEAPTTGLFSKLFGKKVEDVGAVPDRKKDDDRKNRTRSTGQVSFFSTLFLGCVL